ncbi:MAG: ATP-binding cassette domain-containing protein [Novosphingobium sp.]|jgi:ABC-2 type transport system ATP-binding protein|nr:ATP-binding cassette domain-containing protein [Novosphingobium sp.]
MAEAPLLRLDGVSKRFKGARRGAPPVEALRNVSLTLGPGRRLGLVGPDAGGKTTLMRIMAGLVTADDGLVEVLGSPVAELDRGQIGYMPQGGALYAELTVRQNLELYARLRGLEPADNPERMEHLYRLTGLGPFTERPVGQLSGGMRQKLALACAVAAAPRLMLLDEPSVGVDPVSRREIWQLAMDLSGPETSLVWTTNILEDAARCDEVLLLHEGEVRYSGPPAGLAGQAAGRCHARRLSAGLPRLSLQQLLLKPEVLSGRIEGSAIRILTRQGVSPPGTGWEPVAPSADDGFSAMLDDGTPLQPSALAEAFPQRSDPDGQPAIAAIGLTKNYGAFTAAQDISFAVRPGEIFGLLGPNGAGKSTTFRMLCGLAMPSAGRGTVAGRDLSVARAQAREAMGYMPQKFSLYGDLSVAANLRFVAGSYGLNGPAQRTAIERVVEALGLVPYWQSAAGLLPLGIKQRLALGAAVLHSPPVLFLDEPTSGVDPLVRREFWHHINAIAARGTAVLVTTHFMDEAENCDRLLMISQSEAIAQGTPAELRAFLGKGRELPTLEDAFVALIETQRAALAERAA